MRISELHPHFVIVGIFKKVLINNVQRKTHRLPIMDNKLGVKDGLWIKEKD